MREPQIDRESIRRGLRDLGLEAGMHLMVHSSLKRFGRVVGGPQAVIEALMDVLSVRGTLLMPSFNHGAPFEAGGPGYFHPAETPTTNGAIPDAFWRMPAVSRSWNPTHAFAAWGRHATRYTQVHHRTLTMGPDSPLGLLLADDGYCLFLGTDYSTNTFHHAVEMSTGAPCLGLRTEAYPVILPDGRRVLGRTWGWRAGTCPFTDTERYAPLMQDKQRQIMIGQSRATLYRLRDGFEVVADLLTHGGFGYPGCRGCDIRPRRVPQTVALDWDAEAGQLCPDSEALTY